MEVEQQFSNLSIDSTDPGRIKFYNSLMKQTRVVGKMFKTYIPPMEAKNPYHKYSVFVIRPAN